jgi:hypothetical protein
MSIPKMLVLLLSALSLLPRLPVLEAAPPADAKELVRFTQDFDPAALQVQDAKAILVEVGDSRVLRVETGHKANWPGVTIASSQRAWNVSAFASVALQVRNVGPQKVTVNCRVDNPGVDGAFRRVTGSVTLGPGESKPLVVPLRRGLPAVLAEKLFGMRGYPGGLSKDKGIDATRITRLLVFVSRPKQDHAFEVSEIRATGRYRQPKWLTMTPEQFFPMIDRYGQFVHAEWPGKTHSDEQLRKNEEAEAADLSAHPGPKGWNQYGGWLSGPKLAATGHFHAQKHRGKWWLVDPEGRLFWSHGVDCVRCTTAYTPITDRTFYFAELPAKDSAFGQFYGKGRWAPHGYYQGKGAYETYEFSQANLLRKYGKDWKARFVDLCHRRLRSWSMNTIANWSDEEVYLLHKTPYVVSISTGGRKAIEGSSGYWGKFSDPFDPSFRKTLQERMAQEKGKSAGDPWCIGYFVDNELSWGDELSLAIAALSSPPEQAAKRAFLADLAKKYGSIEKLNAAWGTRYASWDALAESRTAPDPKKARDDLAAFYTRIAEEYFRVCREAVKQVAPENLYLGCRFAWVNDRAVRAAAKYCDVIGFNKYRDSVADFRLPDGIDMPAIIGEFHFGALDRGMFHTGLRATASQAARAEAYRSYVTGALQNPWLVGTHWFQYGDQATTGRGDGENYQIGLIDVCDTPYPETIRAVRDVGAAMYQTRLGDE